MLKWAPAIWLPVAAACYYYRQHLDALQSESYDERNLCSDVAIGKLSKDYECFGLLHRECVHACVCVQRWLESFRVDVG